MKIIFFNLETSELLYEHELDVETLHDEKAIDFYEFMSGMIATARNIDPELIMMTNESGYEDVDDFISEALNGSDDYSFKWLRIYEDDNEVN